MNHDDLTLEQAIEYDLAQDPYIFVLDLLEMDECDPLADHAAAIIEASFEEILEDHRYDVANV